MGITNELKQTLKRLRLSGLLATLPDRVAYAKGTKLSYTEFLELILNDEIQRREDTNVATRLRTAMVDLDQTFERFDWDAAITVDREKLKDLFSLEFVNQKENVLICGPVGVGKTFIANALAHSACRRGHKVLTLRASTMFKKLLQSRADNSYGRELIKLISPELLIIDDFGLQRLSDEQGSDFYEVVIERYGRASTVITSNRDVHEWMALFDDSIMANSALDRIAHNAHQLVIEGESYRKKRTPKERKKA
ncbi:MAG: IS21-like element helper ATPase IstB [Desulfobacteraceae bacterium]|nr:IS21-like element helper ATPase IstB [Desulfobacteraceae bacterium]